ncbi:MAG: hypothetical protein ACTTJV_09405 [Ottowia sp.]
MDNYPSPGAEKGKNEQKKAAIQPGQGGNPRPAKTARPRHARTACIWIQDFAYQ